MNLPSKPTRKHTVTALLAGFLAGYLTRMAQKARRVSRSRAYIAGVLDELRGAEKP